MGSLPTMKTISIVLLLAIIAFSQCAAKASVKTERKLAGCVGGYWAFHTRNTLHDPNFGPFDCLNGAVPCAEASNATQAKQKLKAAWTAAGGKSYKYMSNGYCPSQVSQSNTWNTGSIVWKFSKLARRLGKKGKKSKKGKKVRALGKKGKKSKKGKKRELGKKKNKKSKKSKKARLLM